MGAGVELGQLMKLNFQKLTLERPRKGGSNEPPLHRFFGPKI